MSKKPGKHRWSLTLLYSGAFFLIQLAAVLITAALSFLLTKPLPERRITWWPSTPIGAGHTALTCS